MLDKLKKAYRIQSMKTLLLLLLVLSASAMDLTSHLKQQEGFRSSPYLCTQGKWTIGYGHRCDADAKPITEAQASAILAKDIALAQAHVESLVGKDAPQEVKDIVTSMVFQMGYTGVAKFKKTLSYIKAKDYKKASVEMLKSTWYKQTPKRAKLLADMMSKI